ncbi:MAG: U32 family peptidase [Chloroflexota bacterium]|nr:U32 family peptidase [Chloroflexota bacterium]
MDSTRRFLEQMGLPGGDAHSLPTSEKRFPDGAQYRVEIPSTEGPEALATVVDEADRAGIHIHRVSQGSGVMMMTDQEVTNMARLAAGRRMEVSLFARPNAAWDTGAMAVSSGGRTVSPRLRGQEQLVHCLEDVRRAAALGVRSVLLADEGALWVASEMRKQGELPADMQFKMSVMMASANPASIKLMENLGADTYNVPTDLTLAQIAAIRQAVDIPLDVYVEAPDDLGGFVRQYELPELVRVAAPVYIKFGLRNAPNIYPAGAHIATVSLLLSRERVRRARLGLDLLARYYPDAVQSEPGAEGLALPCVSPQDGVDSVAGNPEGVLGVP